MKKKKPKAISLFCGAGGCSLGFHRAGYDIIYACDNDRNAISTYKLNFKSKAKAEVRDINEIDLPLLMKNLKLRVGQLDFLIGGPPCQGFSTAGTRFWDDPRNHLLKSYVSALSLMKPKWFLMENVEGLLTTNEGNYIAECAKAFIDLGYKIRIEKVYSQEFDVPQRRKRVLIIGNRLGMDFEFPKPIRQSTNRIYSDGAITIKDAISDLPSPGKSDDYPDHFVPVLTQLQKERVGHLKPGQTMKDLPEHLQHESFKRRANRRVADGTPTEKRGGSPSGLKKLVANQPSLTITSAATREFIHPTKKRLLTLRECARIQTFPDDFRFCGSSSDQIKQIGNAIPPKLAEVFASHIYEKYGFDGGTCCEGALLGINLTKANAMSPALLRTSQKLDLLYQPKNTPHCQESLFES